MLVFTSKLESTTLTSQFPTSVRSAASPGGGRAHLTVMVPLMFGFN